MSSDFRNSNTFKVGAVLLFIVAICVLATQLLRGNKGGDEKKGFVAENPNAVPQKKAQTGGMGAMQASEEQIKNAKKPNDPEYLNSPPPTEGAQAPPPRIPSKPGTSVGAIQKKKPTP
jgi:hypothetical protein